jgi:alpha-1,4-digalacturonate transport system substrate-binding protein
MKTPAFTANEWKNTSFSKVSTYTKEQIVQALMGNITAQTAAENVDKKAAVYFK